MRQPQLTVQHSDPKPGRERGNCEVSTSSSSKEDFEGKGLLMDRLLGEIFGHASARAGSIPTQRIRELIFGQQFVDKRIDYISYPRTFGTL